jgi:hypothetical protein
MAIEMGGACWRGLLLGLVLLMFVVPPLQPRVGCGGNIWYGLYGFPAIFRWRELVVPKFLGRNQ